MKKLIDLHCDTLDKMYQTNIREHKQMTFQDNDFCVSIPKMKAAGTMAQFFACFTYLPDAKRGYDECYEQALTMMDMLKEQCELYPEEIAQAFDYDSYKENAEMGKISAFLTVEEGGIIQGKMERIDTIYEKGVRLITPLWNYENCFGYPNSDDPEIMQKGLKPFGIEAVRYASEKGMILDVSHSSDGTFDDILRYAKGPVIASHSNCRALCNHRRNLTDEMIRRLADRGGVAGLNFYGEFLGTKDQSLVGEMAVHAQRMIDLGGEDYLAIGTDFDGFDGMVHEDIPTVSEMEILWHELKKQGITERILDKIWYGNAERILREL